MVMHQTVELTQIMLAVKCVQNGHKKVPTVCLLSPSRGETDGGGGCIFGASGSTKSVRLCG